MDSIITVLINDVPVSILAGASISVRERDEVQFLLKVNKDAGIPVLHVEDFEVELRQVEIEGDNLLLESRKGFFFREVFGISVVRCELQQEIISLVFNVLIHKLSAHQIEEMIRYLFSISESLIRVCLSRSTFPVGSSGLGLSDPETTLSTAEQFVETLLSSRMELQHQLRKRLVPKKTPIWMARSHNVDIDPYDVLSNLDVLMPVSDDGDIHIMGRNYSVNGLDVTSMVHTANVFENAVLLGGVMSVKRGVESLSNAIKINSNLNGLTSHDKEHESLSDVMARVTTGSMQLRCASLISHLDDLIRYFTDDLGVKFLGELKPVMTPFVRASRVYRSLFEQIHSWYGLGIPSLIGLNLLLKLRTVSKIYEYFVLYKILDYYLLRGWEMTTVVPSSADDDLVPAEVNFELNGLTVTVFYDVGFAPFSSNTQHLDLVDLRHSYGSQRYWWRPDFVLRLANGQDVRYFILDAKYSNLKTVEDERLPRLIEKYFIDTAVYDAKTQSMGSERILAIMAIFPGTINYQGLNSHWKNNLTSQVPRLPFALGATLATKSNAVLHQVLDRLHVVGIEHLQQIVA